MLTRQRLPQTDLEISALCYGTGMFGSSTTEEDADRLFTLFRDAGGNFFDTAHCYGFWSPAGTGASERVLGTLIRRHRCRDHVVIATKGGHPAVEPDYPRPDAFLSPEVVHGDIEDSLRNLRVETLDLYYLHRDDTRVPVGEIIEMLNAEIAAGRLRSLGASNWSIQRIAEANAYADAHRLHGFVASQPQWNLSRTNLVTTDDPTMRSMTPEDLRWHRARQFPAIPYSSTACGYFATGGVSGAESFDNPISRGRLARAQTLAAELGRTPNQIALAYLHVQEFPVIPIAGASKPAHLQDALAATTLTLTGAQRDWLLAGDAV